MQTQKCLGCSLVNFADAKICKRCSADLTQSLVTNSIQEIQPNSQPIQLDQPPLYQAQPVIIHKQNASSGDVFNGIIWLLMVPVLGFAFLSLVGGLASATSAPQQAAAAGMAIGYAVIPYCGARALTEAIRSFSGK